MLTRAWKRRPHRCPTGSTRRPSTHTSGGPCARAGHPGDALPPGLHEQVLHGPRRHAAGGERVRGSGSPCGTSRRTPAVSPPRCRARPAATHRSRSTSASRPRWRWRCSSGRSSVSAAPPVCRGTRVRSGTSRSGAPCWPGSPGSWSLAELISRLVVVVSFRGPKQMGVRELPGPAPTAVSVSATERTLLERVVRAQSSPQALARRARMILLAAQGQRNEPIAEDLGCSRIQVRQWRNRWAASRTRAPRVGGGGRAAGHPARRDRGGPLGPAALGPSLKLHGGADLPDHRPGLRAAGGVGA